MDLKIDARESEQRKESAYQFFKEQDYNVNVLQLPVGDFLFDDKVIFEYKTANDIINSIIDSRVFRQSKRMQQYPYHYIIVVGDVFKEIHSRYESPENPFFSKYRTGKIQGFSVKNYIGALATLSEYDNVLQVENQHQAFMLMNYLASNIITRNPDLKSIDKPVCKMTDAVGTFLSCIEGISLKKSVMIKEHLHIETLRDLLNVTYDDLVNIKGVGSKTALKILEEIG